MPACTGYCSLSFPLNFFSFPLKHITHTSPWMPSQDTAHRIDTVLSSCVELIAVPALASLHNKTAFATTVYHVSFPTVPICVKCHTFLSFLECISKIMPTECCLCCETIWKVKERTLRPCFLPHLHGGRFASFGPPSHLSQSLSLSRFLAACCL